MAAQLHIGEVAQLLGITTKTIRHYHKIGLVAEPQRTASGYRLYAASDVVQMVRIRRLQRLGLSLAQIQRVLGEPTSHEILRQALLALATALDEEIIHLHLRREHLALLLNQATIDVDQPDAIPVILARVQSQLSPPASPAAAAMWEQDRRIFGMLENLALPDGYQQQLGEMVDQALSDPTVYSQMRIIAEQLAALADAPADSPLVEQLVAQARAEGWLAQMHAIAPASAPGNAASAMLGEVMLSVLAPAQRRFLHLMMQGEAMS